MEKIISNRSWFKTYLIIRNIIFSLLMIWVVLQFTAWKDTEGLKIFISVTLSLLLVLLLFDTLQKPSLFEVFRKGKELKINLYQPDVRYLVWFNEERIRSFHLEDNNQLEIFGEYQGLPWKKKIKLVIHGIGDQKFVSNKIDISWARKFELKQLVAIARKAGS